MLIILCKFLEGEYVQSILGRTSGEERGGSIFACICLELIDNGYGS